MGKLSDAFKSFENIKLSDLFSMKGKSGRFIKFLIAFKIVKTVVTLLIIFFYGSNLFS